MASADAPADARKRAARRNLIMNITSGHFKRSKEIYCSIVLVSAFNSMEWYAEPQAPEALQAHPHRSVSFDHFEAIAQWPLATA